MTTRIQIAAFTSLGLLWGSEWFVVRAIDMPPLRATGLRYAMAAVLLAGFLGAARIALPQPRQLVSLALTGVTMLALPAMLTGWAAGRLSPGLLVVLLAMTPLIAALLEGRASGSLLACLVGGVAGTALIASQGLSFDATQWAGAAAVSAAAGLIASSVVSVKRRFSQVHPAAIAAIQLAAASACVGLRSAMGEGTAGLAPSRTSAGLEVLLAVLANALAFPLYYWLLARRESFELSASQWLITLVALSEGLIFVREIPSGRMISGMAFLLASLWFLWRLRGDDDRPLTIQVAPTPREG